MTDDYEEVGKTETKETEVDLKLLKIRKGTQTHFVKKKNLEKPKPTRIEVLLRKQSKPKRSKFRSI